MPNEPYIKQEAGNLITADDWNDLQSKIQADIETQVSESAKTIKEEGVDRAGNADNFDEKAPDEWIKELDELYAPKVHDHEGQSEYRRFIKKFNKDLNMALLKHDLGKFPLVDVYKLLPVTDVDGFENCKLLFYYGHKDGDEFKLRKKVYRDYVPMGIKFEYLLRELNVDYDGSDTIGDVLNDLWTAFMKDPNDEIKHCETPWIEECCGKKRTVKDLKKADEWDDLYVAIKPAKCGLGADLNIDDGQVMDPACRVTIEQINYDTVFVQANGLQNDELDLMFLLRS